ncbi:MAG TPA: tetratricopeptide repeat protein, partial [Alphaproteobacteria bacterium]|nr:tetratricopeptide repeat protein [Alphaproteobacteria bacterium]
PSKGNFRSGGTEATQNMPSSSSSPAPSHVRQIADDDVDQTLLDTAEKMIKQGDLVSATVLYRRAVAANPKSPSALTGLAKLFEAQGRPREALEAWRSLAALDDGNIEAHRGIGRNLMSVGLYAKAIPELIKASQLGGEDDLKSINLLAMAQLRGGDPAGSIDTLKNALAKHEDLITRNNLGFAYIMAGDTNSAITVLEPVAKDPSATAQQRQNLALAYGLAGRDEDARAIALQDLPPAAVANNLKTYKALRDKLAGKAEPVIETKKPHRKKPRVAKKEAPASATPVSAPAAQAPAAAPTAEPAPQAAPAAAAPEKP